MAQQAQAAQSPPIRNPQSAISSALRRIRFTEFQLLIVPSLMAVIGLITIFLVPRGDTSFTWRDISVSLGFVFLLFMLTGWFSAIGFQGDQLLFPIVATLSGLGLIVVQRLHPVLEQKDLSAVSQRQVLYLAVGLIAMWATVVFFHSLHLLKRYKYLAGLAAIGLMVLTMVVGTEINGAKLWIVVGPVQVQPGEFVKLLLVFFMAAYLDDKRELLASDYRLGPISIPPIPYLIPLGLMWAMALLIVVVQNDFGSALLYFTIFLTMLYVASGRLVYVVVGLAAFAVGGLVIYRLAPHVGARVVNWLDPWRDGLGGGFQIIQGQYAITSGGVFGTGLGYGNLSLIPEIQTDFVFAAIGEELGLLGTLGTLALYLLLSYRGLYIALQAVDGFARLVAVGLTTILAMQSLIIIGGVLRLIPLTGITLPFISYGGTSLIMNFILVGLLLCISDPRRGALR